MSRTSKPSRSTQTYCDCGEPKGDRAKRCVECTDQAIRRARNPSQPTSLVDDSHLGPPDAFGRRRPIKGGV